MTSHQSRNFKAHRLDPANVNFSFQEIVILIIDVYSDVKVRHTKVRHIKVRHTKVRHTKVRHATTLGPTYIKTQVSSMSNIHILPTFKTYWLMTQPIIS